MQQSNTGTLEVMSFAEMENGKMEVSRREDWWKAQANRCLGEIPQC